ncbi:MAG: hypothetical protein NC489_42660 [Ruminococcus flavefaciens]|nr:hypothetical protein [Ruminococcus flavefaciens]
MSIRHPVRLPSYSEDGSFYPRELSELNGKLYIKNDDGSFTLLNGPDNLTDTGVSAEVYGPKNDVNPGNGGSFSVPSFTVDAKGRVVSAGNNTITLPNITHVNVATVTDTTSAETAAFGSGFTVVDGVTRDSNGHVTKINTKTITLPNITHMAVTKSTNTTSTAAPAAGSTFTAVDSLTQDDYGHITKINTKTVTMPVSYKNYTATIDTTWSGSAAPFTKTVTVSGITANDEPVVSLKQSSDFETAVREMNDFDKIYRITTADNSITLYASRKTANPVTINLKCIR